MGRRMTRRGFLTSAAAGAALLGVAPALGAGPRLRRADRRRLRAAIDALVPADGRMPAASAVGGVAYLESLAARDADFRGSLSAALAALGPGFAALGLDERTAVLARFERDDPERFSALRDAVYEGYYSDARVWRLLGYRFRGGPAPTAALESFDERTVARVSRLPRLYREVE